ncbi:unnamed protein product [marine sediment metagenome]|uniref:Uncharacterized protein n=1 Tax=marine sediment metagenome TaxID=412755 RepID=X1TCK0_9ZZZZ
MSQKTIDKTLEKWQEKVKEEAPLPDTGRERGGAGDHCPEFTMEEWIRQDDPLKDDPKHCRPCRLGVPANWYFNELQEKGHEDLAAVIEHIATRVEGPDMPLILCREFDIIKAVVEEPLRERLKDFDCATQSFNPDDVVEDESAAASKSR